jgi:dihydroneopterin aldolase
MPVKNNTTLDHLFVEELEMSCRVGTTPKERAFPQILKVSLSIFMSLEKAGKTDDLQNSLDYADVISKIKKCAGETQFSLVEKVAEVIAAEILNRAPVQAVSVCVSKKVFPDIKAVGAFIHRQKSL